MPTHPTRYIEIDSDFRNRSLYPCPAEFSVPVYCSSRSRGEAALTCSDPYRASYPYQAWTLPPTTTFRVNGWDLKAVWPIRVGERADAYSPPRPQRFSGGTRFEPSLVALGSFPLSGATLYVFGDLDQKTWDEALEKGEYDGDVQSSRILSFPSGYLSSDVPLIAELETPLREGQDLTRSWYLIDFDHDPYSETNPTLFGPRDPDSLASVDSYIGTFVVPYYWTSDDVPADDQVVSSEIVSYDDVTNLLTLAHPLPRKTRNPVPSGSTYTIRGAPPRAAKRFRRIKVSSGSVFSVQVLVGGTGYVKGELFGADRGEETLSYFCGGGGQGFVGRVERTGAAGEILSVAVTREGSGMRAGVIVLQPLRAKGGGGVLQIEAVYQSLDVPSAGPFASMRPGEAIFVPELNRYNTLGFINIDSSVSAPVLPQYSVVERDDAPTVNIVAAPSTYPPRIPCPARATAPGRQCPPAAQPTLASLRAGGWTSTVYGRQERNSREEYVPLSASSTIQAVLRKGDVSTVALHPALPFTSGGLLVDGTPAYDRKTERSGYLNGPLLELLPFTSCVENSLTYTGSTVSQSQMVCYEIRLISLLLPNLPLRNEIGGIIAFYPYVYVEFRNQTAPSSGMKGMLYSNNPNSNRALFRVNIDDTNTPDISKFIKLTGDRTRQTVKFKPNDYLVFSVYLPDGSLFETERADTIPPLYRSPPVSPSPAPFSSLVSSSDTKFHRTAQLNRTPLVRSISRTTGASCLPLAISSLSSGSIRSPAHATTSPPYSGLSGHTASRAS